MISKNRARSQNFASYWNQYFAALAVSGTGIPDGRPGTERDRQLTPWVISLPHQLPVSWLDSGVEADLPMARRSSECPGYWIPAWC